MTVKNQNFEMVAGDTKNIVITVAIADITGASVKWALKKSVFSASNAVYKDTATGGVSITDAAAGKFTVALAPSDTVTLKPGDYYHEAEVTDAAGNVSTVTTGKVTLLPTGV